jgi:hypothetical protein
MSYSSLGPQEPHVVRGKGQEQNSEHSWSLDNCIIYLKQPNPEKNKGLRKLHISGFGRSMYTCSVFRVWASNNMLCSGCFLASLRSVSAWCRWLRGQYRSGVAIETANHDGIGSDPIYHIAQASVLPFCILLPCLAMFCQSAVLYSSWVSPHVRWTSAMRLKSTSPLLPFDEPVILAPEVTGSYLKVWGLVKPC